MTALFFVILDYLQSHKVPLCNSGCQNLLSCAFCLGFAYALPHIPIKYDLSYGIYIYHMVVINVVLELGFQGTWGICAIVLMITILLASLSYFTIGVFSRKRKAQLNL